MDVADRVQAGRPLVKDELGERAQKLFQDFLEGYTIPLTLVLSSAHHISTCPRCADTLWTMR